MLIVVEICHLKINAIISHHLISKWPLFVHVVIYKRITFLLLSIVSTPISNTSFLFQVSKVFEGPHGLMCSTNAHNQTDNTPRSYPLRQIQKKHQTKTTKDKKIRSTQSWHEQVDNCFGVNYTFCLRFHC